MSYELQAIGGYYVKTMGSCLFNIVSSYRLTLTPSVNGFAKLNIGQ